MFKHVPMHVICRQHQEDDKDETHLILALNKCSSSQGIAIGVGDDLSSLSVSNLSVKLSGNVLIIPSG